MPYFIEHFREGYKVRNAITREFMSKKFFKTREEAEKQMYAIKQNEIRKILHKPPYKKPTTHKNKK